MVAGSQVNCSLPATLEKKVDVPTSKGAPGMVGAEGNPGDWSGELAEPQPAERKPKREEKGEGW